MYLFFAAQALEGGRLGRSPGPNRTEEGVGWVVTGGKRGSLRKDDRTGFGSTTS